MRSIGVQVGLECLLGALLEIVILPNKLLELGLHVGNLLGRELKLNDWHAGILQVRQKADFVGLQEQQTAALGIGTTSSTAHSVDVIARVIWRVKLNNEIDSGNLSRGKRSLVSPQPLQKKKIHSSMS